MTTLNIGGHRVQIDDSFLKLSPEQQQKTVDEIASTLKVPGGVQGFPEASRLSQQLQGGPGVERPRRSVDLPTATAATINGIVSGIPVIGPMARDITDRAQAGVRSLMGEDYGEALEGIQERRADIAEAAPISDFAGTLAGGMGSFGAAAKVPALAEALGVTGAKFIPRVAKSTISSGAVAATDEAIRGGDLADVIESGLIGSAGGAFIPLAGKALAETVKAGGRVLAPTISSVVQPAREALRRTGNAFSRDAAAGNAGWGASDEVAARSSGIPVINADRGGETVRALSRSVANQSPEARQTINTIADDRFAGQGARAVQMVRDIAGGSVDDVGYQQAVRQAAQAANRPAYRAAYSAPEARAIWSPNIRQMMQSDMFRKAIDSAESVGTDFAALTGGRAVRNPFVFNADGTITLRQMPDGSRALPDLPFWDIVQRNLRRTEEVARRAGDNETAMRAEQLRRMLTSELDSAVPAFRQARSGAATFFDAEDALEAGKKFAANMRMVPEAKAAFGKFSAPEQAAFRTGYASTLIDRIMATRDRVNVINQVFGNQASREMIELVFGAQKARQLEAYVRVESLVDMLRGTMGNSTTARQLMEMGLGAGSGYVLSGGDLMGAGAGALAARGARAVGQRVDNRVLQMVAKHLMSGDPAIVQKAVAEAMKSPAYMTAIEGLSNALAAPARGAAIAVNQ